MKPLTPKQLKRARTFPQYTGTCPTCQGRGSYKCNGQDTACNCLEQLSLQRRYFAANIGSLYHIISFDDFFEPEWAVGQTVRDYIDKFEDNAFFGRGITFYGPLGTGKSFAATLILKELVKRGHDGYFITFDDLLNLQSKGWKDPSENEDFYTIRNCEVLVIDELFAAEKGTRKYELLAETLERIIRFRVANRLPTIVTTNLSAEEEKNFYPRVHSNLATCQVRCLVDGDDARLGRVRSLTRERIQRGDRKAIV